MIRSQFGKHEDSTRGGRLLAQFLPFAGLCLAALGYFAADHTLPNILANDNRGAAGRVDSGILTLHFGTAPRAVASGSGGPPRDRRLFICRRGTRSRHAGPVDPRSTGTELRVLVHTRLRVAAAVHGLHQHPGKADDYMQLAPDETKEAHFTAGEPGSYFYWASTLQGKPVRRRAPTSEGSMEARPTDESMEPGLEEILPIGGGA